MHMHPAKHIALADHLQSLHEFLVALRGTADHFRPIRGGMGAGCKDCETMPLRRFGGGTAKFEQLLPRVAKADMRPCGHFELSLQHFTIDTATGARFTSLE